MELDKDTAPQIKVAYCLKIVDSKPIAYNNSFHLIGWEFISQRKVKCVDDIIVTRDIVNIGMERKEVIEVISYIVQANHYVK